MKSISPPTPVSRPSAAPCGLATPFGKGLVSEQPLHGLNPPSVLAVYVVVAVNPRVPNAPWSKAWAICGGAQKSP